MHRNRMFLFLVSLLFAISTWAQNTSTRVLVLAGHLLDVKSGRMLDGQQVLIENDKIVSVGPQGSAPANARII
ncbi:MAG: hypothetical protein ACXVZX_14465, partial [Terriglobales bacterium]